MENTIRWLLRHLYKRGDSMNDVLYTIGHSQHKTEYFIEMLKVYRINYVLDVRSTPYSQFASDYNKENIKKVLSNVGIQYGFMGRYFGARQEDRNLYTDEGYLDFERTRRSIPFQVGMQNVMKGVQLGYKIALMCTEKDPMECHRAIMVARTFYENGLDVQHILWDKTLQSHAVLNKRLLDLYYPDRNQMSLFFEDNKSEEEYLQEAYERQNEKIGYHIQDTRKVLAKV